MKLLRLIRRRQLAYELLDEYDADHRPIDLEAWRRAIDSGRWKVALDRSGSKAWREAVEAKAEQYPAS